MKGGRISVVIKRSRKDPARIGLPKASGSYSGVLALAAGMFCVHECAKIHFALHTELAVACAHTL
jgi:hypothetical protein